MVNKVLLIEDDIKISDLVKDSLLDEGYVVDQAFDGEEGYFKILANQPDLIILDIMIPKMNGFKVCAKVREHGVMSPILMLTAKNGEYDVEEGLDTGANDYLRKPFSMIELLARVRKLLKKDMAPTNTLEFQDLKIVVLIFEPHSIIKEHESHDRESGRPTVIVCDSNRLSTHESCLIVTIML